MELIEFIKARLDEDEAYARNAFGDHNDAGPDWREPWSGAVDVGGEDQVITFDSQISRHMVRHDPARVLREVEAKRAIVAMAETYASAQFPDHDGGYGDGAEDAVAHLATVYADHPDYREEWKP